MTREATPIPETTNADLLNITKDIMLVVEGRPLDEQLIALQTAVGLVNSKLTTQSMMASLAQILRNGR